MYYKVIVQISGMYIISEPLAMRDCLQLIDKLKPTTTNCEIVKC